VLRHDAQELASLGLDEEVVTAAEETESTPNLTAIAIAVPVLCAGQFARVPVSTSGSA